MSRRRITGKLLLWAMLALRGESLCPQGWSPQRSTSLSMVSRSISNSEIAKSRQKDRPAKTLYDYLGASPKDTQEQLKIRYTTLVKTLHPDSNPDKDTQNSYYDLSDINAAWEILKNPLERKKYDRSLQAKEIAQGIESLVTMGIHSFQTNAIPWLQKTADTTVAAVEKAQEVNEQARSAYGVFELEQQSKAMDQKANMETSKATKIQKEIDSLGTKKLESLQTKDGLSGAEAQRIFNTFSSRATFKGLSKDLRILLDNEGKHRDAWKRHQSTERANQAATRKVEQAMRAEDLAQKRFEEAQQALKDAKQMSTAALEEEAKTKLEEKNAFQVANRIEGLVEKAKEKVRLGLLQQQDIYLDSLAAELRNEQQDCEQSASAYRTEAEILRQKAQKAQKEQKRQ